MTRIRLSRRSLAAALAIASQLACASPRLAPRRPAETARTAAPAEPAVRIAGLKLLGEARLASGLRFEETVVGGLSGITYDPGRDRYYAIADDPSSHSPSRFYTLRIDLAAGSLAVDGAQVEAVTLLRDRSGRLFKRLVMDAEGIALTPHGTLLISSEGNIRNGVPPSLREFDLDGRELRQQRLPRRYRPRRNRSFGLRHNKAFEALGWAASGDGFYLANENAIHQDGPAADVGQSSAVRIQRYDYDSGRVLAEHVYRVEPVSLPPPDPGAFRTNGLVELADLGNGELLALERSFATGAGNTARLYAVSIHGATDVHRLGRLEGRKAAAITPASKRLLLDLDRLGVPLDNLEGMTFGPRLPDGRRSLLLISDDNFNPAQKTQILALAVRTE
jgi:3-phytase